MCLGVAGGVLSPKSRPDPTPASMHPSTGCLPKEPMGQPGLEPGETAGAVPAHPSGHTTSLVSRNSRVICFLGPSQARPPTWPQRLASKRTCDTEQPRQPPSPLPLLGLRSPHPTLPSPTSTYAVVKCSTHRAPAQFSGGAAGAAAAAAAAIYSR